VVEEDRQLLSHQEEGEGREAEGGHRKGEEGHRKEGEDLQMQRVQKEGKKAWEPSPSQVNLNQEEH